MHLYDKYVHVNCGRCMH